jgi:hypothetical protein
MNMKLRQDVAFITTILIVSVVILPEFESLVKFIAFMFIQFVLYAWVTRSED